ncbi:MAG: hypothetical protein OFPII_06310 [Osedax symbiont Rs1]|nr:MAG: hypothetical protein OFPII_06310 [Osedax symbiont Rs1]
MLIRILLVATFIVNCVLRLKGPWRYFQINALHFNEQLGIYSKNDIDAQIPASWRLPQSIDDGLYTPESFPVFVKPEWGQNGQGVRRADNINELSYIRNHCMNSKTVYVIQQAAVETREFEIFYIRDYQNLSRFAIISVTETCNTSGQDLPINSIHNQHTYYSSVTPKFSAQELDNIWHSIGSIGHYHFARVGVRANSLQDLQRGDFKVIEINLYLPMPINLMDIHLPLQEKLTFVKNSMRHLARLVDVIPDSQPSKPVFIKKTLFQARIK